MVQLYFMGGAPECSLEIVNSGRKCVDRMATDRFDVVLVDLMMPELDGLQVLGHLASRRDSTPVIMVSGHGQNDLAVQALRAGAVDCIDKNSPEFRRIAELVLRYMTGASCNQRTRIATLLQKKLRSPWWNRFRQKRRIDGFLQSQRSHVAGHFHNPGGFEELWKVFLVRCTYSRVRPGFCHRT